MKSHLKLKYFVANSIQNFNKRFQRNWANPKYFCGQNRRKSLSLSISYCLRVHLAVDSNEIKSLHESESQKKLEGLSSP